MKKILFTLLLLPLFCYGGTNQVAYNLTTREVLEGSLDNQQMSIASISKLMTVYTVIKAQQDLNEKLKVTQKTRVSHTKLSKGMVLSRYDLINLSLITSDNVAAITLSQNFPGGQAKFIETMNKNANELNMHDTKFVEPTGLSPMNISTIQDLVILTSKVSELDIFRNAAQSHVATGEVLKGKKKVKVKGNPTSKYFGTDGIITIKTGFTNAAGFCITLLVYNNNNLYNVTVLGARTKKERQLLVEKSLNKILKA